MSKEYANHVIEIGRKLNNKELTKWL
jgi:hypothetical protein